MIKTNLFLVLDANIETLNTKVSIFDAEIDGPTNSERIRWPIFIILINHRF